MVKNTASKLIFLVSINALASIPRPKIASLNNLLVPERCATQIFVTCPFRFFSLRGGDPQTHVEPSPASALPPATKSYLWSPEDDHQILQLQAQHGNKWTQISKVLGGGRTSASIRQRFGYLQRQQAGVSSVATTVVGSRKRGAVSAPEIAVGDDTRGSPVGMPAKRPRSATSQASETAAPATVSDAVEGEDDERQPEQLTAATDAGGAERERAANEYWTPARGWEVRGESLRARLERFWGVKKRTGKRGVLYALGLEQRYRAGGYDGEGPWLHPPDDFPAAAAAITAAAGPANATAGEAGNATGAGAGGAARPGWLYPVYDPELVFNHSVGLVRPGAGEDGGPAPAGDDVVYEDGGGRLWMAGRGAEEAGGPWVVPVDAESQALWDRLRRERQAEEAAAGGGGRRGVEEEGGDGADWSRWDRMDPEWAGLDKRGLRLAMQVRRAGPGRAGSVWKITIHSNPPFPSPPS